MESETTNQISRRQAIGIGATGLGALGAAGISALQASSAAAAPASLGTPRVISSAQAGLAYHIVGGHEFFTSAGAMSRTFFSGIFPGSQELMTATVPLPPGSTIRGFSFWADNGVSTSLTMTMNRLGADGFSVGPVGSATAAANTFASTTQTDSGAMNQVAGTSEYYTLSANMTGTSTQRIFAARVAYVPAPIFVAISPARVYDSRKSGNTPNGLLAPNSNRVVSVKDARNDAGAVTTPDIVPAGATAITFNLTVTGTTGPNFLSVTPGDATSVTASSINFPGGDDRANGGVSKLDASRQIKVFNGDQSGSTHFIIDVTGYYF